MLLIQSTPFHVSDSSAAGLSKGAHLQTTLISGLLHNPPHMQGLLSSMEAIPRRLFSVQFTAWTMESMLKRVQTFCGFVPPY